MARTIGDELGVPIAPDSKATLDRGVICEVEEHRHTGQRTAFGKRTAEVICHIVLYAHRSKYDGELLAFALDYGLLEYYLLRTGLKLV